MSDMFVVARKELIELLGDRASRRGIQVQACIMTAMLGVLSPMQNKGLAGWKDTIWANVPRSPHRTRLPRDDIRRQLTCGCQRISARHTPLTLDDC